MKVTLGRFTCATAAMLAASLSATAALASGTNTFGFGIEGFRDTGKESDNSTTDTTNAGSITGYLSHSNTSGTFFALDGRISYGTDHFDSSGSPNNFPLPVGSVSGVPQWEVEMRARFGKAYQVWDGTFSPYIGLGTIYHRDEGKGYTTDQGYELYDRDSWQFYIPIGASYSMSLGGWSLTPLAEADIMFYGDVNDHVTNIVNGGTFNESADNSQHFGYGGRAELMFGKDLGGSDIEIGPFVRYLWVDKSSSTPYAVNIGSTQVGTLDVYEPKNTSTEVGAALRYLW